MTSNTSRACIRAALITVATGLWPLLPAPPVRAEVFTFTNACGNNDWHSNCAGGTNWNPNQLPGPNDTAVVDNFLVQIQLTDVTIRELNVFSSINIGRGLTITDFGSLNNADITADIGGPGEINFYGNARWFLGGFANAHLVRNHNSMSISAPFPGTRGMSGATLTNFGSVEQLANVNMTNARIDNRGEYALISGSPVATGTGTSLFENRGTLSGKSLGAALGVRLLNENGVVTAGTFGHTLTINNGSTFNGGQILVQNGGVVTLGGIPQHQINGSVSASGDGNVVLTATDLHLVGQLQANLSGFIGLQISGGTTGSGTIINSGQALLEGASIRNAGGLLNTAGGGSASMIIGGTANSVIDSRIVNQGQLTHTGRTLGILLGGQLINEANGRYEFADGATTAGITGVGTFVNNGMLIKKGSQTNAIFSAVSFTGGEVDVQAGTLDFRGTGGFQNRFTISDGAAVAFNNSGLRLESGARFEGDGAALLSSLTVGPGVTTFELPGDGAIHATSGTLTLEGTIENKGRFGWFSTGRIAGGGTFINTDSGTLELANNPQLFGNLLNQGTARQDGATMLLASTARLRNEGEWRATSGSISQLNAGTQLFENAAGGAFLKSGPAQLNVDLPFNNAANVTVSGGTLALRGTGFHVGGAEFTANSSSTLRLQSTHSSVGAVTFQGPGLVDLVGTYLVIAGETTFDVGGGATPTGLRMDNASSHLSTQGSGRALLNGRTEWIRGTMSGGSVSSNETVTGGSRNNGRLELFPGSKTLAGVLVNSGTVLVRGALTINGGHLRNESHMQIGAGFGISDFISITAAGTGGRFDNFGSMVIAANSNAIVAVPFDLRDGTVQLNSPTSGSSTVLFLTAGGESVGSGVFDVRPSSRLEFRGGVHRFDGDYLVTGSGTAFVSECEIRGSIAFDLKGSSSSGLSVASATLNGLTGAPVTNLGIAAFSNATIAGAGGVLNHGTLTFNTPLSTVQQRFNNGGQVSQRAPIFLQPGGVIRNQSGGFWFSGAAITGAGGQIDNLGRIVFQGSAPLTESTNTIQHDFNNAGRIDVFSEAGLVLPGNVTQYNPAEASLTGGTWYIDGTLTLGSGAALKVINATVEITPTGVFTNLPKFIPHSFTNKGFLGLPDGYTVVGTLTNEGILDLEKHALLTATNVRSVAGSRLTGEGTVKALLQDFAAAPGEILIEGTIAPGESPGQSPGTITLIGETTFASSAAIEIDITGPVPDLQHDVLAIEGAALLDGRLDIRFPAPEEPDGEPYTPVPGDRFRVITVTGGITGNFSSIDGRSQFAHVGLPVFVEDDFIEIAAALYGDANTDGIVNIGDFARLAPRFNLAGAHWSDGDFNFDGIVNISDFAVLAANFNLSAATLPARGGPVPEPAATVAIAFCAGMLNLRRR